MAEQWATQRDWRSRERPNQSKMKNDILCILSVSHSHYHSYCFIMNILQCQPKPSAYYKARCLMHHAWCGVDRFTISIVSQNRAVNRRHMRLLNSVWCGGSALLGLTSIWEQLATCSRLLKGVFTGSQGKRGCVRHVLLDVGENVSETHRFALSTDYTACVYNNKCQRRKNTTTTKFVGPMLECMHAV